MQAPTTNKIPQEVVNMATHYTSPHIDGWTKNAYREKLEKTKEFIINILSKEDLKQIS